MTAGAAVNASLIELVSLTAKLTATLHLGARSAIEFASVGGVYTPRCLAFPIPESR